MHGDNIYYKEQGVWRQVDSHHSLHNGQTNQKNLVQDTSGRFVLVSNHFVYLGDKNIKVPEQYLSLCPNKRQRDYITLKDEKLAAEFVQDIKCKFQLGVNGFPINWREYNQRTLF